MSTLCMYRSIAFYVTIVQQYIVMSILTTKLINRHTILSTDIHSHPTQVARFVFTLCAMNINTACKHVGGGLFKQMLLGSRPPQHKADLDNRRNKRSRPAT